MGQITWLRRYQLEPCPRRRALATGLPSWSGSGACEGAHRLARRQGWGRVCLRNIVLDHPDSERGPKVVVDQSHPLTENGAEFLTRITPADAARPLRITLAWTDAPGAAGANPALTNDLDLEVLEIATGRVFKGNVFANGFSVTGGAFDARNNVECVYVPNPAGAYEVRVIAASLTADARPPFRTRAWQDFALVIDNAVAAT